MKGTRPSTGSRAAPNSAIPGSRYGDRARRRQADGRHGRRPRQPRARVAEHEGGGAPVVNAESHGRQQLGQVKGQGVPGDERTLPERNHQTRRDGLRAARQPDDGQGQQRPSEQRNGGPAPGPPQDAPVQREGHEGQRHGARLGQQCQPEGRQRSTVMPAAPGRFSRTAARLGVAQVAHPGDRLDLHGVDGEQQRAAEGRPVPPDEATQQGEDQSDVPQVQQQVGRVKDARVERRETAARCRHRPRIGRQVDSHA